MEEIRFTFQVLGGTFSCCTREHPDGRVCDKQKIVGREFYVVHGWLRRHAGPALAALCDLPRLSGHGAACPDAAGVDLKGESGSKK